MKKRHDDNRKGWRASQVRQKGIARVARAHGICVIEKHFKTKRGGSEGRTVASTHTTDKEREDRMNGGR
jgi:hypothetical protein